MADQVCGEAAEDVARRADRFDVHFMRHVHDFRPANLAHVHEKPAQAVLFPAPTLVDIITARTEIENAIETDVA